MTEYLQELEVPIRKRLATLAKRIEEQAGGGRYRAFVDSAPVLERAVAERAGLGWIDKNMILINSSNTLNELFIKCVENACII